jgi:hypothetical protein
VDVTVRDRPDRTPGCEGREDGRESRHDVQEDYQDDAEAQAYLLEGFGSDDLEDVGGGEEDRNLGGQEERSEESRGRVLLRQVRLQKAAVVVAPDERPAPVEAATSEASRVNILINELELRSGDR